MKRKPRKPDPPMIIRAVPPHEPPWMASVTADEALAMMGMHLAGIDILKPAHRDALARRIQRDHAASRPVNGQ